MIGNSKVTLLIDQATDTDLTRPDTSLNLQICQEIHSKPEM